MIILILVLDNLIILSSEAIFEITKIKSKLFGINNLYVYKFLNVI